MNPGIIIPTLNEKKNIGVLISKIKKLHPRVNIVVVDDNSQDGTPEIVKKMAEKYEGVHLIQRKERLGIGAAIVDGFKFAVAQEFDPIITMDGDQSHDPIYLKKFFKYSRKFDLVIGSRYISGVRVDGWRFRKLLISKLANMYVAYIMIKPIWDFTSGYRAYSAKFLKQLNFDTIPPQGYLFQIHMVYLAYSLKLAVKEIPFVYKDTEYSYSKISPRDRRITFFQVLKYRAPFLEIVRHLTYLRKDYHRFVAEYEELLNPPPLKNRGRIRIPKKFSVSVGVMAHNEELNIAKCLQALIQQKVKSCTIKEIIVVSSGSTDRTDEIVRELAEQYPKIKLITEDTRKGKASAINEFLKIASGDICIIESADTIPNSDVVEKLVKPFFDKKIGITGGHPIPVNSDKGFVGYNVHKLWRLHHLLALEKPKCGEMIAFRNILTKIPSYTAVDEAVIEALVTEQGFQMAYVPEAIVRNKGPENLRDFFRQRMRIATGHKHLASTKNYKVSTFKSSKIFKFLLQDMSWNPREWVYLPLLIFLEAAARVVGSINFYLRDKNPYVWDIAKSTKDLPGVEVLQEYQEEATN
ncbi:MAG: hypothetical protein Kow0042_25350 [Calditrichia bacterium]